MSNTIEYHSGEIKNKVFKFKKINERIISKNVEDKQEYILFRDIKCVYFEISTYLGSLNAEHYYGTLTVDRAKTKYIDKDTKDEVTTSQDWNFDMPKGTEGIKIELRKKLDAKSAAYLNKKNSCYDWMSKYKTGEYVNMFDTQKEVILEAKRVLETNFEPHIKIRVSGYTYGVEDFINETFGNRLQNKIE